MNTSLYIHIPFCKRRCHYCDFNTYTSKMALISDYVDALIKEIRIASEYLESDDVHTIYFGGGTPSLLSPNLYKQIFNAIHKSFNILPKAEISLEANPGTLSLPYLDELKQIGFNRLSIGVQSTDSFDLKRLDRTHNIFDVLESVKNARKAGFDNINLDLIFNLPWQDLDSWGFNLTRAIELNPEHFSIYSLIIEPRTPLYRWHQKGLIATQDQDLEADMFEETIKMLNKTGYKHYEISNWAKEETDKDYRCVHNLQYWYNLPYIGIGAGAHGYLNGVRTENVKTISRYINRMQKFGHLHFRLPETASTININKVDKMIQMKDTMWLGLRLVDEGVNENRFHKMHGCSMYQVFQDEIQKLESWGLVRRTKREGGTLKLTRRGVMLANQAFMMFV